MVSKAKLVWTYSVIIILYTRGSPANLIKPFPYSLPASAYMKMENTVFPRNLAVARFYFKAPFGAATIRGRLDFEGGVYVHSFNNKPSCLHVKCPCAYRNCCRPVPCGEISRAAFIGTSRQIDAATIRGRRDFEVRRDFEEMRYIESRAKRGFYESPE